MLTIAIGSAGLLTIYVIVRMMIEQNNARLREEFRLAIDSLATRPAPRGTTEVQASIAGFGTSQETVGAIAAATAALGARKVRIRPAKEKPVRASADIWAQHGRAGVWSAHDIAQRWH